MSAALANGVVLILVLLALISSCAVAWLIVRNITIADKPPRIRYVRISARALVFLAVVFVLEPLLLFFGLSLLKALGADFNS